MRIAISGTGCQGKSTFQLDFLDKWPQYKAPKKTYRDVITEKNLAHSTKTTKITQRFILDFMVESMKGYTVDDNIIYDRCPWDALVYSMWGLSDSTSDIDEEFIDEIIPIVRESMRELDLIFFIPISKVSPILIVEDEMRETEAEYINSIDNIFKDFYRRYAHQSFEPFFPQNDVPAIIEIFGSRTERLHIANLYIDVDGDSIPGDMDSLIKGMEDLVSDHKAELFKTSGIITTS